MTILVMVLRNLARHKMRAALSFFSVFLAAIVLHLYLGATAAMKATFEDSALQGTLLVKARYGAVFTATLPNSYNAQILEVPGVKASTPIVQWLSKLGPGSTESDYVYVIGVDPTQFRRVVGRGVEKIPEDVYQKFIDDDTAVLTSRGVRLSFGRFTVGNSFEIPIRESFGAEAAGYVAPEKPWTVGGHVVAEMDEGIFSNRVIVMHASALERTGWKRNIGLLVRVAPGADPDDVGRAIERKLATSKRDDEVEVLLFENWTGGMKVLAGQLAAIVLVIVVLVGSLAAGILMYGVSAQGFDLLPQIATLRALALRRSEAIFLLAGEGVILSMSAALCATLLLWLLTSTSSIIDLRAIDQNFAPVFKLNALGAAWVIGGAALLAIAGALLPATVQTRLEIAELRRMRV